MRKVNKCFNKRKKENQLGGFFSCIQSQKKKVMTHRIGKVIFDADKHNSQEQKIAAGGDPC